MNRPAAAHTRLWRFVLIAAAAPAAWMMMMAAHELGHVIGAWLTGGNVVAVDLHPLRFSSTLVDPNPRPRVVAWMGPAVGAALPLMGWIAWRLSRGPGAPGAAALRWFAGFCLIANGAYLGVGWMDDVGDAGDLLRHGAAVWQLATFGAVAVAGGLLLWHGRLEWPRVGYDRPRRRSQTS